MKRKYYLMLLALIWSLSSFAQEQKVEQILSQTEKQQAVYKPAIQSGKQLWLKMTYGSPTIANPEELNVLKGSTIAAVDIVCTDHPRGADFSRLTAQRLINLGQLHQPLLKDDRIQWNLVRQTDCETKEEAQKLFHGIVVTYRPAQSKELVKEEITYLKEVMGGAAKTSIALAEVIDSEAKYLSDSVDTWEIEEGMGVRYSLTTTDFSHFVVKDSVLFKTFERNPWEKMLIVSDLTGSMSPYTAQLFVWLRLNSLDKRVKEVAFFNDGDNTPDIKKVIGKTGGIYQTETMNIETIEELAYTTMRAGFGGDGPENDVEALLKGMDKCPECDNIILIADNWAPIKDRSLLEKLNKPIKVILCGTDAGINPQYLTLARKTGGSVHLMEKDLTNLMELNEGEKITIRGQQFRIRKGEFVKGQRTN